MKKAILLGVCTAMIAAVLPLRAAPGPGDWVESFFDVTFEGDSSNWNRLTQASSGGNGWTPTSTSPWWEYHPITEPYTGPWYQYPQTNTVTDPGGNTEDDPMWWNQWWYDHPYDPDRHKIIDLAFDYSITNLDAGDGYVILVINYSTPEWSGVDPTDPSTQGLDPRTMAPPADSGGAAADQWIGRVGLADIVLDSDNRTGTYQSGIVDLRQFEIPYNPEWVSVDVRGYNFTLDGSYGPGEDAGRLLHACVPEPASLMLLALSGGLMLLRRRRG